ncbi:MAG: tetratricopeptide repeat protein [Robiginitalea sp.]|nr:tetratricopeptide repeat protein [Robiginitalea sp.]
MNDFQYHLDKAEQHLKASQPDLAVPEYQNAMNAAPPGAVRMHLSNTLARVLELQGNKKEAVSQFLQTLDTATPGASIGMEQRAIALNNLGRLSLPKEPKSAIGYFDKAIAIYEDLSGENPDYKTHLAHSLMARGEAYYLREQYWFSKKDYKAAMELRNEDADVLSDEMRALAHYQLGAIYTDEFNAHDARTNYQKALEIYLQAMESDPSTYRPLVAACLNNLAVTLIQMEEYEKAAAHYERTLEHYKTLSAERPEVFRPYLASTYANMGVLLADKMKQYSRAYQANENAMALYRELAETHPERYTHYLATAYHNAGIYTLETSSWPQAASFLSRALALRRDLEAKEPGAFRADYCATALNLLEFYQRKLEEEKNLEFKARGLALLGETAAYLEDLPELPATENMKSDFGYFEKYFNAVDEQEVRTLDILQKIRAWDHEIDSTLVIDEKKGFQDKILGILRDFYRDFPENRVLLKPYVLALNNTAWLHLCKREITEARKLLEEGIDLGLPLPALGCNKAHCDLIEGKTDQALQAYRGLFGQKDESGKDFREVIGKDLQKLDAYGLLPTPSGELLPSLDMPA